MADEQPTLEGLLARGEVASALLLKGRYSDAELALIAEVYSIGLRHGRALADPAAEEGDG